MTRTIYGHVPSKSNNYRIGVGKFYKSAEVRQYEKDFAKQWVRTETIDTEFELTLKVYLKNRLQDLDGTFKVILDNLQRVGAIKNDNLCVKIVSEKHIDKINPRIELGISKIN